MKYSFYNNRFEDIGRNINKIAISASDEDITWKELYQRVEKLAEIYKDLDIPKGHPILIYGHKECFYPIAVLAAIMSDIPYIPVDFILPIERIKKIIEITGSQVVINCGEYDLNFLAPVIIDKNFKIKKISKPYYKDSIHWMPNDPIRYIIFTSGSTGEPKGVQITQSAIVSFARWLETDFKFSEIDVFINQAIFSFDLSVYELVCYALFGATIILNDNKTMQDSGRFIQRIKKYRGTVWVSTPSFAYLCLNDENFHDDTLPEIKTFLFCGELLPNITAKKLLQRFKKTRVLNTYGPTEATVATTLINVTTEIVDKFAILPVGYPKEDCEIIIDIKDDKNDKRTGEIIIAGDNVSSGYFRNEELNTRKFFSYKGKRAFRTGDVGYFEDNFLFFTGRDDDQIKFHGYRIELDEITFVIRKLDFIEDAVTIPLKRNNEVKRIVSFVILKKGHEGFGNELKNKIIHEIERKIPPYMIPGDIREMKEFPLSPSHKIDKQKLVEIYKNNQSQYIK